MNSDHILHVSKASIVFLDRKIKLPDDGKTYLYNGGDLPENYNPETGVWGGLTTYTYDSQSGNWVAKHLRSIWYRDGYETHFCDDPDFIDACTLTPDEVASMGIDSNKDKDPSAYYVYDMVTEPGTYVSGEQIPETGTYVSGEQIPETGDISAVNKSGTREIQKQSNKCV